MVLRNHSSGSVTRDISGTPPNRGLSIRPVRPKTHITSHEFVDMGDGLKWATCNIGASSPEEYGDYFSWGEVNTKNYYTLDYYFDKYYQRYNTSTSTQLSPVDDAAAVNWGADWRMPTGTEWWSLITDSNKYTWQRVSDYNGTGVKGLMVISKIPGYEGNRIFLPAAGYRHGLEGGMICRHIRILLVFNPQCSGLGQSG